MYLLINYDKHCTEKIMINTAHVMAWYTNLNFSLYFRAFSDSCSFESWKENRMTGKIYFRIVMYPRIVCTSTRYQSRRISLKQTVTFLVNRTNNGFDNALESKATRGHAGIPHPVLAIRIWLHSHLSNARYLYMSWHRT